ISVIDSDGKDSGFSRWHGYAILCWNKDQSTNRSRDIRSHAVISVKTWTCIHESAQALQRTFNSIIHRNADRKRLQSILIKIADGDVGEGLHYLLVGDLIC